MVPVFLKTNKNVIMKYWVLQVVYMIVLIVIALVHFMILSEGGTDNYFGMFYFLFLALAVVLFSVLPVLFLVLKIILIRYSDLKDSDGKGHVIPFDFITMFICVILFCVAITIMSGYV